MLSKEAKAEENEISLLNLAAESQTSPSAKFRLLLDRKVADVNAKNAKNQSCLYVALERKSRIFVEHLLRAGAKLDDPKLKYLPFDSVTLLKHRDIILTAPRQIEAALRVSTLFSDGAQQHSMYAEDYLSLSKDMESFAVEMMDKAELTRNEVTDSLFSYALENEKKKVSNNIIP